MRCWRSAGGLGRLRVLVLSVAAVSAIAMTVPASARSHAYSVALYARGYYGVAKAQGFSPYGGSSEMASNAYGPPVFGYQEADWQTERAYAAALHYRTRPYWHRPV